MVGEHTLYFFTFIDIFNRKIISWVISESPKFLKQTMKGSDVEGGVLHSD